MSAGIILAGQGLDLMGSLGQGVQLAGGMHEVQQANRLSDVYQQHGQGIAAGEQNALNVLSQIDPNRTLAVQESRLGMDATRLQMQATREQMQQRRAAAARVSAQFVQAGREAEAQQLMAEQSRLLAGAAAITTPEQWDQFMQANGGEEYLGQFENRQVIFAQAIAEREGFAEGLEFAQGGAQGPELTSAAQTLAWRAQQAGLQPGTPEYQEFIANNGRTQDAFTVFDPVSGQPLFQQGAPAPPNAQANTPAETQIDPIQNADQAFGLQGMLQGAANTAADFVGANVPFPETQQAQSDLRLMAEDLLAGVAAGYPRQPPSWLMQEIRELIPRPGNLGGTSSAVAGYQSLRRRLETELEGARSSLGGSTGRPSVAQAQETTALISGHTRAISLIDQALAGLGAGGQSGAGSATSSGVQWRIVE